MNSILEALQFRHACKKFDPDKKIKKQDLNMILECARLSPSSFGMEAWKFLVLETDRIRKNLRPACWNQPQITDSSHVLVILAKPGLVDPENEYVKLNFARRGLSEDIAFAYIEKYKNHMESEVFPRMSAYAWCSKQCYIVLANIMTAAASQKIDSCPIEGFEKDEVEKILQIDTEQYEVAVIVTLGFRVNEPPPRHRHMAENVIEYR